MPQRPNPLSIAVLGELNYDRFEDQFDRLARRIDDDDQARSNWIQECADVRELIDGKDKRKNKPWKHASETSVPLLRKLLRRYKPVLYNLVAMADPLCSFKAGTPEAAAVQPTVEEFFTWLVMDHMDSTLDEVQYLIHDFAGDKGCGYLHAGWDYRTEIETRVVVSENLFPDGVPEETEAVAGAIAQEYDVVVDSEQIQAALIEAAVKLQQGAPFVRITHRKVVKDKPKIVAHSPFQVIVPPNSDKAEDAEYVAIRHFRRPSELRQMALDGILNPQAVEVVIEKAEEKGKQEKGQVSGRQATLGTAEQAETAVQTEAGVNKINTEEPITIYQVYCMMDYNGDGIDERCVLWYSPVDTTRLALFPFPFSFPWWPITRFDFERIDRRPYISRGIGHHCKALQEQLNKQHRARSDAIDIQLAPTFQMRVTSGLRARSIKWGPGRVIEVQQVGDIAPVDKSPMNLQQYLQAEGELQRFAEDWAGSVINDLQATGRRIERRSAFEARAVSGQSEAIQGMDAHAFQNSIQKIWQSVWEMWLDLGPEEIYYNVTGQPLPKLFRKSENNYGFQLMPAGTPGNTDRNKQLQLVMQALQIAMQNPTGDMNISGLFQQALRWIDPKLAMIALTPTAQIQQMQILNTAAQSIAEGNVPEEVKAQMASGALGGGPQ